MDEQVEILRAIWNEMKALNGRVTTTNSRLDELRVELRSEVGGLRAEMNGLRADLDVVHRRSVERDARLATSIAEFSRDVRELTLVVHDWRDEHRLDRADLRDRVERLERHVGLEPR